MRIQAAALLLGLACIGLTSVQAKDSWQDLGTVRNFDVHNFENHNFSSEREKVLPEILEYTRTAIQAEERLTYRSPGEGLLHFYCASPQCGRIRVEVTQGADGPVIWRKTKEFRPFVTIVEPDARKFAKAIVKELAEDYEASVKEIPAKIPIKD